VREKVSGAFAWSVFGVGISVGATLLGITDTLAGALLIVLGVAVPLWKFWPDLVRKAALPQAVAKDDIRSRALHLSDEILAFLARREATDPTMRLPRQGDDWHRNTQHLVDYSRETMATYSRLFGARVIAMRNEFLSRGFRDPELDQFYGHPTNPLGIRAVGERIGALARQIPEA